MSNELYRVEKDHEGCQTCGHDAMWTVVRKENGEDVAFGQSWGDKEFVDDLAEYLNDAWRSGYDAGRDAEREELERKS